MLCQQKNIGKYATSSEKVSIIYHHFIIHIQKGIKHKLSKLNWIKDIVAIHSILHFNLLDFLKKYASAFGIHHGLWSTSHDALEMKASGPFKFQSWNKNEKIPPAITSDVVSLIFFLIFFFEKISWNSNCETKRSKKREHKYIFNKASLWVSINFSDLCCEKFMDKPHSIILRSRRGFSYFLSSFSFIFQQKKSNNNSNIFFFLHHEISFLSLKQPGMLFFSSS